MGIIFSDADIRAHVGDPGVTEYIWNVGKAFAEWLPEDGSVVVVRSQTADTVVVSAFIEGLLLQGRTVIDAGVGAQQAIYASLSENKAAGAALLDHSMAQDLSVISLFDSHVAAISVQTGLREIGELVNAGNFLPAAEKGTIQQ